MAIPNSQLDVRVFQPSDELIPHISSFFLIRNKEVSADIVPPLGYPVIMFHLRNKVEEFYNYYDFQPTDVMIVGQLTHFSRVSQVPDSEFIGVNLRPSALARLTTIPIHEFTDTAMPAVEVLGNSMYDLLLNLRKTPTVSDKIELLNAGFLHLFEGQDTDRFDDLVELIVESKGALSNEEIHALYPASERTLQRLFKMKVGVSLKMYQRIIRNLSFFRLVQEFPDECASSLMLQLGYYDFSHFAKDFKLLSGLTPKQYFAGKEEFAHLLVQL
jgi:AraC-like DNA-binding protein